MADTDKLAAADARTPEQVEIDRLRSELDHFTKSGIIEIAVRNPNVSSWMVEWENRALKAEATITALEAENKRLREALEPFAEASRKMDEACESFKQPLPPDDYKPAKTFNHGELRAARRARDISRNRRES